MSEILDMKEIHPMHPGRMVLEECIIKRRPMLLIGSERMTLPFCRRIPSCMPYGEEDHPFRAPHHSVAVSRVARSLVVEARKAVGGVLLLEEVHLFHVDALRALREELDPSVILIGTVTADLADGPIGAALLNMHHVVGMSPVQVLKLPDLSNSPRTGRSSQEIREGIEAELKRLRLR